MKVLIIGNGIAGTTVATSLRNQDKKIEIMMISAENEYFFSRPALMYIYMKELKLKHTQPYEKKFWKKNNINLVKAKVTQYDFDNKKVFDENGNQYPYDKLVLAVGGKGNKFGWPGQDLKGVHTFTNLFDLEAIEKQTKNYNKDNRVAIVGGGLIGLEVSEMLHHRNIPTTFLVREKTYWDLALSPNEGKMIEQRILDHHIDLQMQTELKKIDGDGNGEVKSLTTNKDETIKCQMVVIAAGVSPNIAQFNKTSLKLGRGIKVTKKLESSINDVYAVGDCAEIVKDVNDSEERGNVELLWYTGKMQGEVCAKNILGDSLEHNRGIWYNSAKFYDIDYHTYGLVGHRIEGEKEFYYRVPNQNKSFRITYLPQKQDKVIGFNFLGIRYRHSVCEKWLHEERPLDYVLEHLQEANFDPEFFERFEAEVLNAK